MSKVWPYLWAIFFLSFSAEALDSLAEIRTKRNSSSIQQNSSIPKFARRLQVRQHDTASSNQARKTVEQITKEKLDHYGLKADRVTSTQPPATADSGSSINQSTAKQANRSSNGTSNVSLFKLPRAQSGSTHPLPQPKADNSNVDLTKPVNRTQDDKSQRPTVIHFLFMINNWLPHADIWQRFFSSAPEGSMHAYVHCQDFKHCRDTGLFKVLPNLRPIPTQPTWYCHDLVTAMTQLLKASLSMNENSVRPNAREKFVFLSESTLPLKTFSQVHAALAENDDSDFCVFPMDQWASTAIQEHSVFLVKHHQWVVLNREHAEKMVDNWQPVQANGIWKIPLTGKHWKKGSHWTPYNFKRGPHANWCTDEWAFFATIFGAFEPGKTFDGASAMKGFSGGPLHTWGPEALSMQGTCRTFSYWDQEGENFIALAKALTVDPLALSCYPKCFERPATFLSLSDNAIRALHESPFLFARKFNAYMALPNFQGIVLGAEKAPMPPSGPVPALNFAAREKAHQEAEPPMPIVQLNASQYQFVVMDEA